ncbi:MAG: hypothetical protein AB1772_05080, partial [Candidatus Zixiibacteriota bacterium]
AELVLAGQGGNRQELLNALDWMNAALYSPYLETENLPRILDCLDQMIKSARNRVKAPEEYWVNGVADGYRFDNNPLMLTSICFLTQAHMLQRMRWLLTDPGGQAAQTELAEFIDALRAAGDGRSRQALLDLCGDIESMSTGGESSVQNEVATRYAALGEPAKATAGALIQSLPVMLGDIPDVSLSADWTYLCNQARSDLLASPSVVLTRLKEVLALLRRTDNARLFMVSNTQDRTAAMPGIEGLTNKLARERSTRQSYSATRRVLARLNERDNNAGSPIIYAGLVHQGTQNGVLIFSARIADEFDTTTGAVINCLSGKLYGGRGPHGLFTRTWAAGLAYSNGYTFSQQTGRVNYYAERCPDVAETMRFVVNELKNAKPDSSLVDYAIAQIFRSSRSQGRYEQRAEAMAADLADGFTPEVVRRYSEKVLQMRRNPDLLSKLEGQMRDAYGPVLVGYGPPPEKTTDSYFFLIGPEPQFQSLEEYIASEEGPHKIHRLYPRDFWLTP